MRVSSWWIMQKHPNPLIEKPGQGHLAYRAGACAWSGLADLSSDPCQNPVVGPEHPATFSFLFGHPLSFCFMSFKVTENLQRGTRDSSAKGVQKRAQHQLGPNTKYNSLSLLGNVLHTLKTGDLAEILTPQLCQPPLKKGSSQTVLQA